MFRVFLADLTKLGVRLAVGNGYDDFPVSVVEHIFFLCSFFPSECGVTPIRVVILYPFSSETYQSVSSTPDFKMDADVIS